MKIFASVVLFFLVVSGFAQVRPDQFLQETNPANANFEFYSQKGLAYRRASFDNVRKRMLPFVIDTVIGATPSSTGNTTNLGQFIKDATGVLWYIDGLGNAVELVSGSNAPTYVIADTSALLLIYAPSHGLAAAIASNGYVPIKADFTVANSTSVDSIFVAYAIDAPDPDSLLIKFTGALSFSSWHGKEINQQYFLQDNGTEGLTAGTLTVPTAIATDSFTLFLREVGPEFVGKLKRVPIPSPAFGIFGGDSQVPSDSVAQAVILGLYVPAGIAQPGTIFTTSYGGQSNNPTYIQGSPNTNPLTPSFSWLWDGVNATRISDKITSIDLQDDLYGGLGTLPLEPIDSIAFALPPTDADVVQWATTNYNNNGLRLPNGCILYYIGTGSRQNPDYEWMIIDDLSASGGTNFDKIIKRIKQPSTGGNLSGLADVDTTGIGVGFYLYWTGTEWSVVPPSIFNNGLTDSLGTAQLGGTLHKNTSINTGTFSLALSGNANINTFQVSNTSASGTYSSIYGTANAGYGVRGVSTSSYGGRFESSSGTALYAQSSTGSGIFATAPFGSIFYSSNNSTPALYGYSNATSSPTDDAAGGEFGIGANLSDSTSVYPGIILYRLLQAGLKPNVGSGIGIRFKGNFWAGASNDVKTYGYINSYVTDSLSASSSAGMEFKLRDNNAINRVVNIASTGQLTLDGYANAALSNPDSSLHVLTIDATGDVHSIPIDSLGGTGGADGNGIISALPAADVTINSNLNDLTIDSLTSLYISSLQGSLYFDAFGAAGEYSSLQVGRDGVSDLYGVINGGGARMTIEPHLLTTVNKARIKIGVLGRYAYVVDSIGPSVALAETPYTTSYRLPVTSPSFTLNDTTVMAWRGLGSAAEPIGFLPYGGGTGGSGDPDQTLSVSNDSLTISGTGNTVKLGINELATDSLTIDTIYLDFEGRYQKIFQIDMTSATGTKYVIPSNPFTAGVYTLDLANIAGSVSIVWPASFKDLNGVGLGTVAYTGSIIKTFYYDGTNYRVPPDYEPNINFDSDSVTTTTLTIDLEYQYQGVQEIDMTSATNLTLTISNPAPGGVYTFHFLNVSGTDNVTWPSSFYDAAGTALGTDALTAGTFYTCYYNPKRAKYYCK